MNIIRVEFDTAQFQSDSDCTEWLSRNSDYNGVTRLRDFKLRSGITTNMSGEKRHAWIWAEPTWSYTKILIVRPTRYILIWVQDSLDQFTTENIPPASVTALEKLRKQKDKEQKKKATEEKKKVARRQARLEKKRKKLEAEEQESTKSDTEEQGPRKKIKVDPKAAKGKNAHLFKKKIKLPADAGALQAASPPRSDSVVDKND